VEWYFRSGNLVLVADGTIEEKGRSFIEPAKCDRYPCGDRLARR
jgi:hypothetical protein